MSTQSCFDVDLFLAENNHYYAEESNKIPSRVEQCGKYSTVGIDPYTGKSKARPFFCKNWRICANCAKRRMNEFTANIAQIQIMVPDAKISTVDNDEWPKISRYLDGKDNFVRIPIDAYSCVIIHKPHKKFELRAESTRDLDDMDAEHLASGIYKTPEKTKISGKLGGFGTEKKDDTKEEDDVELQVRQIHINTTSREDINKIEEKMGSPKKSKFLSQDELQYEIQRRENRLIYWANKLGFLTRIDHVRTRYVKLSDVHWEI